MTFRLTLAVALLAAASSVSAQVGHEPSRSPYLDLEFRQELTAYTGYFIAARDPAGVAPRSGPVLGARYEVRVGGPASFTARFARVFSERAVANPTQPRPTRYTVVPWPLYLTDASLSLNLTGQKSIQHFVPILNMGFGLASDFKPQPDVGGYRFGTTFAFSFGGGMRWTPGGPFQVRADIADYLYQIQYPTSYYLRASDSTRVLPQSQARSVWKHNATITVGASYLFFR